MKKLTYILLFSIATFTFNCSTENTNEQSDLNNTIAARFINESAANVDLVVYDVDGNVVSTESNIKPGASASIDSIGETTFRIVTEASDRIAVLDIENANSYYVVLNDENAVSTIQTARL